MQRSLAGAAANRHADAVSRALRCTSPHPTARWQFHTAASAAASEASQLQRQRQMGGGGFVAGGGGRAESLMRWEVLDALVYRCGGCTHTD